MSYFSCIIKTNDMIQLEITTEQNGRTRSFFTQSWEDHNEGWKQANGWVSNKNTKRVIMMIDNPAKFDGTQEWLITDKNTYAKIVR